MLVVRLVSDDAIRLLKTQRYHLIGQHTAVKSCKWLHESLVNNRPCYKQQFYGIKSHQCIQMTPSVHYCTLRCLFCWRAQDGDGESRCGETEPPKWDGPEEIIEGCLNAQRRLLSGYKGNIKVGAVKFEAASKPRHVAISLAGEPTLYPFLGDLIGGFHNRGFTTFLVSNGTIPKALAELSTEPTQMYVSVCAFDEKSFQETCRPQITRAWERLNETLSLLPSFSCRKAIRITLTKGINLGHAEEYARLIERASPDFVEPKAYMHVGFSRLRLGYENMPSHSDIMSFSTEVATSLGYNISDECKSSRVVLLSKFKGNSSRFL